MDCVIGIDIGTTNIKAAAYSLKGKQLAFASQKMQVTHPQPGYSEHDPQEIWDKVTLCLKKILAQEEVGKVCALGVASFAEAGLPLGADGKPLYNIIAWYDQRTGPQAKQCADKIGTEKIYYITGHMLHRKFGLNKILWLKDNHPEIFEKTHVWLSMADYILYRLTGEYVSDYSLATKTLAFDVNTLQWSEEILTKVGVPKEIFPPVYPGGTVIGTVNSKAAAETGLSINTPVVTGGHDHACAAIGINIFESGVILDSMGTAEATIIAVEEPRLTKEAYNLRLCIYPHCGKALYRIMTSIHACGRSVEWFLSCFGDYLQKIPGGKSNPYDKLMEAAASAPIGADGLLYIPHIRGVLGYPAASGGFLGIKDTHRFEDFSRALIEGLCYEMKDRLETTEEYYNTSYKTVRIVGGAAKSDFWMQTKATLSGRLVEIPENEEATSQGAALLAALGTKLFTDVKEAASCFYRVKARFEPEKNLSSVVEKNYLRYKKAADFMKNWMGPVRDREKGSRENHKKKDNII